MMKNTIKVSVPVSPETIEREIQLPAYRKENGGGKYVKVISEDEHIVVTNYYGTYNIQHWRLMSGELSSPNFSDCSASEFERAFEVVMDKLSQLQIQHA